MANARTSLPINVTQQIENDKRMYIIGKVDGSTAEIREHDIIASTKDTLPSNIVPDRYRFRWSGETQINFLRKESTIGLSDWFDVLPARKK